MKSSVSNSTADLSSQRPRLRRRLTIALCLFLVTFVGIEIHRAMRQREVVSWVEGDGGFVDRVDRVPPQLSKVSSWVKNHLGIDYGTDVHAIVYSTQPSRRVLARLASLPNLREAAFWNNQGSSREGISEDDLRQISTSSHLENLVISHTFVTERGMKSIRKMSRLHRLTFFFCSFQELDQAISVPQSREAKKCSIPMPELSELDLSFSRVADENFSRFAKLGRLKKLTLKGTQVSNLGIASLKTMTELRELDLRLLDIDAKTIADLKQACPDLKIVQ